MNKANIQDRFRQEYGHQPDFVVRAPGRVNLIGEHTDYNDGMVFPAAIDRNIWLAVRKIEGRSRLFSGELGSGDSFDANNPELDVRGWAAYAAGMAQAMGGGSNVEAYLWSDIPVGAGVSSSAALELAFGVAWNHLDNRNFSASELARFGQACENNYVGVNCGLMDQMACACGREGHAMLYDVRADTLRYAPIPTDIQIVLCDTTKSRELAASKYNERRSECEEACRFLGVNSLRDAAYQDLPRSDQNETWLRRARHVISENSRCEAFADALDRSSREEMGNLMKASHMSLKVDYEVTSTELDAMANAAWGSTGCIGARMTGAGFGGACVALVDSKLLEDFVAQCAKRFKETTRIDGQFMVCKAAQGASVIG
ncbi:MAG: galactokinase [Fimbriimonadaceae bacterium]